MPSGIRAELILAAVDRRAGTLAGPSNHGYLAERLHYDDQKLLDADSRGVMMAWEGAPIPQGIGLTLSITSQDLGRWDGGHVRQV